MIQELEIEFKNLLTKIEYKKLLQSFHLKEENAVKQENYYFETDHFHLKEKGSALRIRKKNGAYQFTLKQPEGKGLLETHETIDKEFFDHCINGNIRLPLSIQQALQKLDIPIEQLQFKGKLTTFRLEVPWKNSLVVFDKSLYHQHEDYELELEVEDYEQGKQLFHTLLNENNIPVRHTKNKIERFFDHM